ncbi:MetQ/NlpA family ABC transporter substrate-binding protein [Helicobacter sp. MIT 14-3879]|uniref:MetQ/NlpA family ABC transporter substrate-binding protein n=1 Tax=Helicobacter sp. MIT 14-3879 TaxID=2040649 RepID=UPI000E1F1CA2|nr:MetQ/NlpA family ABC transporter substrate-binding protein [Helicobacter sp. MIT 14-3879]RDU62076.1 methionine ABC transporter substrate-binding protein [Helicobacter sp. MIT 14-3879]
MIKNITSLLIILAFVFIGCGENNSDNQTKLEVLKVGASPTPHAKILSNIKDDLKKEGIDLQIIEFSEYVTPNIELNDGLLDANFYQHKPYLDKMIEEKNLKLTPIAKVHIEPLGFYSKKIKNIKDLKDGSTIAIPNDPSNAGRALILLHNNGLIKLKDPTNLYSTELDIIDNPKKLSIKPLDSAMLPRIIDDLDGAIINGNFALQANFSAKDALIIEDEKSPYANILVVREVDINNPKVLKLKEALNSEKTRKFLEDTFKGELVPAF